MFSYDIIYPNHKSITFFPLFLTSQIRNIFNKYCIKQYIDDYGKIQIFEYKIESHLITAYLNIPLQPFLDIPTYHVSNKQNSIPVNKKHVLKILNNITTKTLKNSIKCQLTSNPEIFIEFHTTDNEDTDIKSQSLLMQKYNLRDDSNLDLFKYYRKLSRTLIEYIKYMFSTFINNKNPSDELYEQFIQKKIILSDDSHVYKFNSSNYLSNETFFQGSRLIIPNYEILEKLIFNLKLFIKNFPQEINNYKNRKTIKDFYIFEEDFNIRNTEQIFISRDSIKLFNKHIQNDHIIYHKFIPNKNIYFYRNKNNDTIWIVKKSDTLQDAYDISYTWLKNKSISDPIQNNKINKYNSWELDSDFNILPKQISTDNNIHILKFDPSFYSLLQI